VKADPKMHRSADFANSDYKMIRPIAEIEALLSAVQPRVSIADVEAFHRSIGRTAELAEIDAELDERIVVDPYNGDPPSRSKDKEIDRLLDLLDSLDWENG
jgi:hypothetical protein